MADALTLTPWFPPGIKPVREGVYESRLRGTDIVSRVMWARGLWRTTGWDQSIYNDQALEWRGLAAPTPCLLCAKGFPAEDGYHYATQRLGMIPTTRCTATRGVQPAAPLWFIRVKDTTGKWTKWEECSAEIVADFRKNVTMPIYEVQQFAPVDGGAPGSETSDGARNEGGSR